MQCVCVCVVQCLWPKTLFVNSESLTGNHLSNAMDQKNLLCVLYHIIVCRVHYLRSFITVCSTIVVIYLSHEFKNFFFLSRKWWCNLPLSFSVLAQLGRFAWQFANCKLVGKIVVSSALAHHLCCHFLPLPTISHHFPPFPSISFHFPAFPGISRHFLPFHKHI